MSSSIPTATATDAATTTTTPTTTAAAASTTTTTNNTPTAAAVVGGGRHSPANSSSGGSSHFLVEHSDTVDDEGGNPSTTSTTTTGGAVLPKNNKKGAQLLVAVLDKFLRDYTQFMTSGLNQDRSLKLLQYTLWMVSYGVSKTTTTTESSSPASTIIRESLRKLFNELSFTRYVLRFLGLPAALEATRSGSWSMTSPKNPRWHKILGQIMAWSMIGYYPLEHGAYLQWQTPKLLPLLLGGAFDWKRRRSGGDVDGPTSSSVRLAGKLSAWSCRFWLIYTVTEIIQCVWKLREETNNLRLLEDKKKNDDHDVSDGDDCAITTTTTTTSSSSIVSAPPAGAATTMATIRNLRLQIVRDVLFTLPAIHWSLPNWDIDPLLSDLQCNSLMWCESIACMYQSIRNFQQ